MGGHTETAASALNCDSNRQAGSTMAKLADELTAGKTAAAAADANHHPGPDSSSATATQYDVEHLATFSTATSHETATSTTSASDNDGDASDGCANGELLATNLNKLNNGRHRQERQRPTVSNNVAGPRVALQRLFELEKLSGIWTQRMQIELRDDLMLIRDCETNSIVERFHRDRVSQPEAFNHYNDIYNNIIVFIINQQPQQQQRGRQASATCSKLSPSQASDRETREGDEIDSNDREELASNVITDCDKTTTTTTTTTIASATTPANPPGELHIFQCVSHKAKQLVGDILAWKARHAGDDEPIAHRADETNPNDNKMIVKSKASKSGEHVGGGAVRNGDVTSQQVDKKTTSSTTTTTTTSTKQAASDESRQNTNAKTTTTTTTNNETAMTASKSLPPTSDSSTAAAADEGQTSKPLVVTVASSSTASDTVPIVNVNVKETVQVFNQIAALREKGNSTAGASNGQTPAAPTSTTRPHSSDVGTSSASNGQHQQADSANSETRVSALSPGGQFYKQRSIRATLAPKLDQEGQPQPGSSSSSSSSSAASSASSMGSSDLANGPNKPGSSSVSAAGSSSSRSDGNGPNQRGASSTSASKVPVPPQLPTSNHHHHAHKSHQQRAGFEGNGKHPDERHLNGSAAYTQSHSSSSSSSTGAAAAAGANQRSVAPSKSQNGSTRELQTSSKQSSKTSAGAPRSSNGHHNGHSLHQSGNTNNNGRNHHQAQQQQQQHSSTNSSQRSHGSPSSQQSLSQQLEQVTTNESYVSVLNHCFDDIEKFIIRLQHAYAAMRELQAARRRQSKKSSSLASANGGSLASSSQPSSSGSSGHKSHVSSSSNGSSSQTATTNRASAAPAPNLTASELAMLSSRARGPNADDFFEILSKFKLAFNLLAKLKGCIHEPNAPELVHFLFTPLAIIIESARNVSPPVDPTVVGIPYLNRDALELLSNCCTSKESDLWLSLGPNWTQTIEPGLLKASRLPSSFQPIFSDGWAPVISELELIGLVVAAAAASPNFGGAGEPHDHYRSSRAICAAPSGSQDLVGEPSLVSSATRSKSHQGRHGSEPSLRSSSNGTHLLTTANGDGGASSKPLHHHKKRGSPVNQHGQFHHQYDHATAAGKSPYGPAGYLQDLPADMVEPAGPYRVPKLPTSNMRVARHSMPKGAGLPLEKGSRRNSGYSSQPIYGPGGHFSPPASSYHDESHGHYPPTSGYGPSNPSDDYTELQEDHLAGPSSRRRLVGAPNGPIGGYNHPHYQYGYNPAYGGPPDPRYLPADGPAGAYNQEQFMQDEAEREAMLLDLGPAQTEWFYELSSRGALIVRVLFTRDANNDKELTVKRGELLEILDDSRKWWKARNIDLQVAYVPHTIVAVMDHYQTLDELLTNSPGDMMLMMAPGEDQSARGHAARRELQQPQVAVGPMMNDFNQNYAYREDRRNSKTARGAFRYF